MGVMTHVQLVTEALELAGNTGLATRAQTWLGLVIRRLHEQFSFPQQDQVKGVKSVAAGVSSINLGSGVGGSADLFAGFPVRGIKQVFLASNSTLDDWEELTPAPIRQLSVAALNAQVRTARPQFFISEPYQDGFTLGLSPVPDQTYRLLVVVDSRGWTLGQYSANAVNYYPDDATVVQGIYAYALKHQQDERAGEEMGEFLSMAKQDRVRYGNMNNENKVVKLGGPHVAAARDKNRGPGWMGPV